MTTHPVELHIHPPERMQRIHVAIRLVLLVALGMLGCSSLYWFLYVALPAVVALILASRGADAYFADDAPAIVRGLRWLAAAYSYLWLLTDRFPPTDDETSALRVSPVGAPTAARALLRLVYSLPALLLLAILSFAASVLWVVGALFILVARRVPAAIADFLALTLQYQFQLAAYHLSLVDRYPSLQSAAVDHAPSAAA